MNKNFPFYDWVPKPLGIIFLIVLFIPIMTVSGVYSANSSEMVGGLGIQSEHISFVGFVTSVGMAAFSPFFYTVVCLRRQKLMSLIGFPILIVLSYVCARTESVFVLGLSSLIMGFVRQTLLMTTLFTLIKYGFHIEATNNLTAGNEPMTEEGWDKLDTEKTTSMPTIYFFFMVLGQIGTWLTAWFAYYYEWQYVYYAMMASMLVAVLITLIAMPFNPYPTKHPPLSFSKFGNVVVFSSMCCSFIYIMVYGKTLDWYDDPTIRWSTVICIVSTLLFVYLEKTRQSPYFILEALKWRSIQGGILLFLGLMILNSSQLFVNVFVGVGMKCDNLQVAELGNWTLVGYFIGLVFAVFASAKHIHLKWLFSLGFVFIGLAALYMYFEVQTDGMYERMKWPVIIRATGMMLLYSLTAVYANQQHYITRYAQEYDRMNQPVAANYDQTARGMMYQGKSETEAQQMASISTKGKVQVQATLVTIKEMAGWTIYGCLVCALIVVAVPWPKRDISRDTKAWLTKNVVAPPSWRGE